MFFALGGIPRLGGGFQPTWWPNDVPFVDPNRVNSESKPVGKVSLLVANLCSENLLTVGLQLPLVRDFGAIWSAEESKKPNEKTIFL